MSYVVLARKYRPQSFTELVGQEHVARTLGGAIAQNRVAHAFLFTGVRGVGKTTSARLLAKCLNCLGEDGLAEGPTATPCQVCAACVEIAQGTDLDVQEIDGASYNGVDEVRKLQEGLPYRPARDRYKIYIVDEVHMLSQAAWNAFLKTLEEPPPHVKFIFATTEVHKVPVTILSRCQRYDFKLISAETVAARLTDVLAQEQIEAEPSAVRLLARQADGSMRDAMSLLDRVIAFSGEALREEEVAKVLGVASRRVQVGLAKNLLEGDAVAILRTLRAVVEDGVDLLHFGRELLSVLRDLVAAKVGAELDERGRAELLALPNEEQAELVELVQPHKLDDLLRLFHGFSRGFDEMVSQGDLRAALEMNLVRAARRPPLLPLDELLGRIGQLEKRLQGAAPPPRGGGGGGGGGGARPSAPARHLELARAPSRHGMLAMAHSEPDPLPIEWGADAERTPRPELRVVRNEPAPPPSPPPVPVAPALPDHVDVERYRTLVESLESEYLGLSSVLRHAWLYEASDHALRLGFPVASFLAVQVHEGDYPAVLQAAAERVFGAAVKVELDTTSTPKPPPPTLSDADEFVRQQALRAARAAVENHPAVQAARRILGAELRDIKLPES